MDISETLEPKSDQLDAVDLITGPRTFTIADVTRGNAEQPINIKLAEFPRPWRPSKNMRRVIAAIWGTDARRYAGRRITLYCDPDVTFGKEKVGGTRISHMSHMDAPRDLTLLVSRGKTAHYTVRPLVEDTVTDEQIAAATSEEELRALWSGASQAQQQQIMARVEALRAGVNIETGEVSE